MGRLTYKNQDGTWGLNNGYELKKAPKELYGALCKLKDYEETGLDPGKAAELDEMYLAKCREINELQRQVNDLQMAAGYAVERLEAYRDEADQFGVYGMMTDMIDTIKEVLAPEESEREPEPVQYCFSWDGEEYYSELYQTKEEALQDARAEKQTYRFDEKEVYIAQAAIPNLCWNSNTEYILVSMIEDLIERCGEDGEDGLEVTEEQEAALGKMIDKAVSEWITRYKIKPTCYEVRNPELWEV